MQANNVYRYCIPLPRPRRFIRTYDATAPQARRRAVEAAATRVGSYGQIETTEGIGPLIERVESKRVGVQSTRASLSRSIPGQRYQPANDSSRSRDQLSAKLRQRVTSLDGEQAATRLLTHAAHPGSSFSTDRYSGAGYGSRRALYITAPPAEVGAE